MTYAKAISELQQRTLDAFKVARSSQIASFETTREFAQTLSAQRRSAFAAPTAFRAMTDLTTAFTFALLEQQLAYAKNLTDAFAKPPGSAASPALPPPLLAIATAPPMLTASAPLDPPAEPEVLVLAGTAAAPPDIATPLVADEAIATNAATSQLNHAAMATDDVTTLATDNATVPTTEAEMNRTIDDANILASDETLAEATLALATDATLALATDPTLAQPTDYSTTAATDAAGLTATHEGTTRATSEPTATSRGDFTVKDVTDSPATGPAREEATAFAAPEAPSANSAFPVSSGNAARKPPKAKSVSNNRPKPKRNPGA